MRVNNRSAIAQHDVSVYTNFTPTLRVLANGKAVNPKYITVTALPQMTVYPSQSTFADGSCMCTTAALYWAIACVACLLPPDCGSEKMRVLMQTASDTQRAITESLSRPPTAMLQQHEVLAGIKLPSSLGAIEMYGYCSQRNADMAAFIHVDEIYDMLQEGDAMVVTGGGHSTAVFRADARVYTYDSAPAAVSSVASPAMLAAALRTAHRAMPEFTATLVRDRSRLPAQTRANLSIITPVTADELATFKQCADTWNS